MSGFRSGMRRRPRIFHRRTPAEARAALAQVQAAHQLIYRDPLTPSALLEQIEATAAAIAAAHWLQAAADVTSRASGLAPTEIIEAADAVQEFPHRTPAMALELMTTGLVPHATVIRLIHDTAPVGERARRLQETLLHGIHGCCLVYQNCVEPQHSEHVDDIDDIDEAVTDMFIHALRTEAEDHSDRLH